MLLLQWCKYGDPAQCFRGKRLEKHMHLRTGLQRSLKRL